MLFQSAGMKQTLQYDQTSCRLLVEGLPDVSRGHAAGAVGIITGWRIEWLGRPGMDGQREHLRALLEVVLPYARYRISGVPRAFGAEDDPVRIVPDGAERHRLLRRGEEGAAPQELSLDDAELADLVQVLDRLRLDPRLQLEADLPPSRPLTVRELLDRIPLRRRLAAPAGGLAALVLAAALGSLWPAPRPAGSGSGPSASPAARSADDGKPRPAAPPSPGAAPVSRPGSGS
ncbi:MAG: DUF4335 domain-containing protein [Synechococcaceae cyanobacterium]|nr:DUF4335 domain-containing protein [Synechococcaceae cyanobacterium]